MIKHKLSLICQNETRIDKYISDNSRFSRADVQKFIKAQAVMVDGIIVRKPNFRAKIGSKILITEIKPKELKADPENIPLNIVYEDDDLIVINKPSGMVVHPAPGHYSQTLVNALLYHFKDLSNFYNQVRPGIVHRIDKDTSGLLIVAKNNEAHLKLTDDLKEHKIKRTYLAWVKGQIANDITHINLPIGRDLKNRKKMAVIEKNSKPAITHVFTLKVLNDRSLVRCELETGRTHQIRVHLAHIKHPVLNDPLYGKTNSKDEATFGQYLHAYKLEFNHPRTGKHLVFEVNPPAEFDLIS